MQYSFEEFLEKSGEDKNYCIEGKKIRYYKGTEISIAKNYIEATRVWAETITDKLIDKETANKIRRAIEMTQVAQIFEEEKQQALTQAEEEKRRALIQAEEEKRQAVKDTSKQVVSLMIKKNYPTEEIISLVPNYSLNEVEALKAEILKAEKNN